MLHLGCDQFMEDCGKVQFHSQLVATSSVVYLSTESKNKNNVTPNALHPV